MNLSFSIFFFLIFPCFFLFLLMPPGWQNCSLKVCLTKTHNEPQQSLPSRTRPHNHLLPASTVCIRAQCAIAWALPNHWPSLPHPSLAFGFVECATCKWHNRNGKRHATRHSYNCSSCRCRCCCNNKQLELAAQQFLTLQPHGNWSAKSAATLSDCRISRSLHSNVPVPSSTQQLLLRPAWFLSVWSPDRRQIMPAQKP